MNFKEFDAKMRAFEQSLDQCIPSDHYMIARLDGHKFSKETINLGYEKPFDIEFHYLMEYVLTKLMTKSNLKIIYGYTQSDEISLLFSPTENAFNRKVRKYNSLLAGLASAEASQYLHSIVLFDCRMIPLPTLSTVCDYFVWRQNDAYRNAMNGYCYWTARQEDQMSARQATAMMRDKENKWKYQFLKDHNINFNETPEWQRLGLGLQYQTYDKLGYNPTTKEYTACVRKELYPLPSLPTNSEYRRLIANIIEQNT